jgi:hypothetical protein
LVGALTTHALGGDQTLHLALAGLAAVFAPLAAATAARGLQAYRIRLESVDV